MKATRTKPIGYWNSFSNLKRELLAFIADQGTPGVMPMQKTFFSAGRSDLVSAMGKHGGARVVARRLGMRMRTRRKPRGYWQEFANLERELRAFITGVGTPGVMPRQSELLAAGRSDLANAVRRSGGHYAVAERLHLRMTYGAKPAGYWDDPSNLKEELLEFIDRNGTAGVMPSTPELVEDGRYDLKYGIEKNGGFGEVARRLGLLPQRKKDRCGDSSVMEGAD